MTAMKRPFYSFGLPLLMGAIASGVVFASPSAQAQESFDNTSVQFETDTVVEFEFLESNGVYQSTFGVINLATGERTPLISEAKPSDVDQPVNVPSDYESDIGLEDRDDFIGTPGETVPQPLAEFEFRANTPYAFYLESFYQNRPAGILYSIDARNANNNQRVRLDGGLAGLASGGVVLRWDDTGALLVGGVAQSDNDFDDFVIRAGGHIACPFSQSENRSQQLAHNVVADSLTANCRPL